MKHLLYTLIASLCILIVHAQTFTGVKYNFNSDWKVNVGDVAGAESPGFSDNNWKSVTLPYAWNEDAAFKVSIDELPTGIAWYRKHFKLPAGSTNKKIFLEFEGIRQAGEVYINGQFAGRCENGVMAYGFDISSLLNPDKENIIAVKTDNSWNYKEHATGSTYEWSDKNFYANYGGINKNVFIHIKEKVYQTLPLYSNLGTTGVYVYADNINIANASATVNTVSEVKNESGEAQKINYKVEVADAEGKTVAVFNAPAQTINAGSTGIIKASSIVNNLHFWSWGYGYLYTVTTSLIINNKTADKVVTKTGFRKTAFTNGTFYLNDRALQVKGYAQRTTNEWPAIGLSVSPALSDYSNALVVKSNGNLVRWMHVTPWKQDVESCDRVGLMQSMPAGDAEKDVDRRRWEQRKEVMRDAIIYNRNSPSIIFYECGNKGISEEHMREMKAIKDMYDPFGGRAIGCREMLDTKTVAEYGGEMLYINKSAGKPLWAMEYSRDEGLRKYWDEYTPPYHKEGQGPLYKGQDASDYNHNQDAHAKEDIARWFDYWHERSGTGTRVSAGGVNIIFSESNTHHRGEENYRHSGEVDAMRIPKDGFYAHEVMWNGWVDVEKPGIHILGHWNYDNTVTKDMYVVSSADKVELFLNGKSLGFGTQSYRFLYTFKNVKWQSGELKAVGHDADNKVICEDKHVTAGAPYALRLSPVIGGNGLKANGSDLALIEVEVVDVKGNRCPTALNMIRFNTEGNVEWRGGIAQGPGNYILSKDLPVECGVNRVLLRTTTQSGDIQLSASAEGLQSASITLHSEPFITAQGFTTVMPSEGLTGDLQRGPTPATPSFVVSRKALTVVSVTAGANADSAYKSYDDNETTDWYNDGKLQTAWIEYTLSKPSTINQVVLKLNNFRTRSYPISITVDGKEVFKGMTTKNLGYFTAVCTATKGSKVKIQLLPGSSITAINGTEMNGKKLDDGVERNDINAKGTLSVIEAEIYGQR